MFPEDAADWTIWHALWWLTGSFSCMGVVYMLYAAFGRRSNDDD